MIYTVIENLTRDGRDRSLDYKISGIFVAKGLWEAKVVDAIAPADDDIVLAKTSSSLFNSTTATICSAISGSSIWSSPVCLDQCVDHTIGTRPTAATGQSAHRMPVPPSRRNATKARSPCSRLLPYLTTDG